MKLEALGQQRNTSTTLKSFHFMRCPRVVRQIPDAKTLACSDRGICLGQGVGVISQFVQPICSADLFSQFIDLQPACKRPNIDSAVDLLRCRFAARYSSLRPHWAILRAFLRSFSFRATGFNQRISIQRVSIQQVSIQCAKNLS